MILPGWDSIEATDSWSTIYFWISIGALVLLGAAEIASHYYALRHDSLVAANYRQDKYGTDSEMERLKNVAAQANLRSAELAAKASWRILSQSQIERLTDSLRNLRHDLSGGKLSFGHA